MHVPDKYCAFWVRRLRLHSPLKVKCSSIFLYSAATFHFFSCLPTKHKWVTIFSLSELQLCPHWIDANPSWNHLVINGAQCRENGHRMKPLTETGTAPNFIWAVFWQQTCCILHNARRAMPVFAANHGSFGLTFYGGVSVETWNITACGPSAVIQEPLYLCGWNKSNGQSNKRRWLSEMKQSN